MTKLLGALLAALILATPVVAGEKVSYRDFLARNRSNSSNLTLGMTKDEVKRAMGDFEAATRDGPLYNPWLAEAFTRGEDSFEVLYYLVRQHPPFTPILRSQAIAVVLENGELVAWGPDADARFR